MTIISKNIFISICLICMSLTSIAQADLYELYEKGEYTKVRTQAETMLRNQHNNVLLHHILGKVYANPAYELFDLKAAYDAYTQALRYIKNAQQIDINRYARIPVTEEIILTDLHAVCAEALNHAMAQKSIQGLNAFINNYTQAPLELIQTATATRNSIAFSEAEKQHTIAAYTQFISTYPRAEQVEQAQEKIYSIAFQQARSANTKLAYESYLREYPNSQHAQEATLLLHKLLFEEITKDGSYDSYVRFVKTHPKAETAKLAIETLVSLAKEKKHINYLREVVELSRNIHFEYALYHYYKELTTDGEYITIMRFMQEFRNVPFEEEVRKDLRIAEIGENLDLHRGFIPEREQDYVQYIRMAAPKDKAFVALQRLISQDIHDKNWDRALARVAGLQQHFGRDHVQVRNLMSILHAPYDESIVPTEVPGRINTETGSEYSPVLSIDNKTMYFCGLGRRGSIGGEDIFVSEFENGAWLEPKLVEELSTRNANDAPLSISADGTMMIYFRAGTIYVSNKLPRGWGQGTSISREINEAQWSADAMISSDGNALIFSSIRPENFNYFSNPDFVVRYYHGAYLHQSDIYVSLKTENGWGPPINLGPVINTKYTDRSPFLHPDMRTLYFSSDGHGGLGGMDVFMSTRLSDDCWDCWSTPVNLGKEINTHQDDWGYRISTDGEIAYFAARQPGQRQHKIYYSKMPKHARPQPVTIVSGKLIDKNGRIIASTIVWEDLENGNTIGKSQSDPISGQYTIALPHGKRYGYYVEDEKYYPLSNSIDVTGTKKSDNIEHTIVAISYKEMQEQGLAVSLNNLFFDTNKSDILPHSLPELRRAAQIIQRYNVKIEISGHTDNVGSAESNQALSMRRARAVRDFLVAEGCNPKLFSIVGHGFNKPIDTNETAQGRANNRRVEMRFIQ